MSPDAGRMCAEDVFRKARMRQLGDVLETAVLFGAFDALLTSHASFTTVLIALVWGAAVGAGLVALRAHVLVSGAVGAVTFPLFIWVSRGGWAASHLFPLFPFAVALAYLGHRREHRRRDQGCRRDRDHRWPRRTCRSRRN